MYIEGIKCHSRKDHSKRFEKINPLIALTVPHAKKHLLEEHLKKIEEHDHGQCKHIIFLVIYNFSLWAGFS